MDKSLRLAILFCIAACLGQAAATIKYIPGDFAATPVGVQAAIDAAVAAQVGTCAPYIIYITASTVIDMTNTQIVYRAKTCNQFIYILSTGAFVSGTRLNPATQSGSLATLKWTGNPSYGFYGPLSAMSEYWYFGGIEFWATGGNNVTPVYGLFFVGESYGSGGNNQGSPADPSLRNHHFTFDHCWLHGTPGARNLLHGVVIGGTDVRILDSYFEAIAGDGLESQAVSGSIGCERLEVRNSRLSAGSETVLHGGSLLPAGFQVQNISYTGNLITKDPQYKFASGVINPTWACRNGYVYRNTNTNQDWICNGSSTWVNQGGLTVNGTTLVKNVVEFKVGRAVRFFANDMSGMWVPSNQSASMFTLNLTTQVVYNAVIPANHGMTLNIGDIGQPWNQIQDVAIFGNQMRDAFAAPLILAYPGDISPQGSITSATLANPVSFTLVQDPNTVNPIPTGQVQKVMLSGFTGSWAALNLTQPFCTGVDATHMTCAVDTSSGFGAMAGSPYWNTAQNYACSLQGMNQSPIRNRSSISNGPGCYTVGHNHIRFHNNLSYNNSDERDYDNGSSDSDGKGFALNAGMSDISIFHNTVVMSTFSTPSGAYAFMGSTAFVSPGDGVQAGAVSGQIILRDNILPAGQSGFASSASGSGPQTGNNGECSLAQTEVLLASGAEDARNNVFTLDKGSWTIPTYGVLGACAGGVTKWKSGTNVANGAAAVDSAAKYAAKVAIQGTASDGRDPGTDINMLDWAIGGAGSASNSSTTGALNTGLDYFPKDPVPTSSGGTRGATLAYTSYDATACTAVASTNANTYASPISATISQTGRSGTATWANGTLTANTFYWVRTTCNGKIQEWTRAGERLYFLTLP